MIGVLLINLGTPDAPTVPAVKKYLAEFLMDPNVIDLPWPARFALVYGLILPFRPRKITHAYQKIWTSRGSPLRFHHDDLAEGVQKELGTEFQVEAAFRYGSPSITDALKRLHAKPLKKLIVLPMYPQYSLAATESSLKEFKRAATAFPPVLTEVIRDFYAEPEFVSAVASVTSREIAAFKPDHLLFSFHGLPERQVRNATKHEGGRCDFSNLCCAHVGAANQSCYRAQCFATTRAVIEKLNWPTTKMSIGFQSRLGRTPWIQPFSDVVIPELAQKGVKRLAVLCPSFVADCLETLEEVGIRAREQFQQCGGEELKLIPCVNASDGWVNGVSGMIKGRVADVSP